MSFVKRPVAVFSMSFFVLFCVIMNSGASHAAVFSAVFGALFLILFAVSFFAKNRPRVVLRYAALVLAGIFAAASFAAFIVIPNERKYDYLTSGSHKIAGAVEEELWSGKRFRCYLTRVDEVDGEDASFKAAVVSDHELYAGDAVEASVTFELLDTDGDADSSNYYRSRGVSLVASAKYAVRTGEDSSVTSYFRRLNEKFCLTLHENLSEDSAGIACAVLLGNRSGVSDGIKAGLSNIGISHLIAISGMHVSFISLALVFILRRFRVGKRKISICVIAAMIFYMFLTGFSPSVVRAGVLCCILSALSLAGVSYDGVTALSVCGAGMVLINPPFAYSAAMQLSFSACVGCFAGAAILKKLGLSDSRKKYVLPVRALRFIAKSVIFTTAIIIVSLPVTFLYYDRVSILAPIANIVMIPAFSLILYLAAISIVLSPVGFISVAADKYISAVLCAVKRASSLGGATVSLSYPFSPYLIFLAGAAVIAFALGKGKIEKIALITLASCIALYALGALLLTLQ